MMRSNPIFLSLAKAGALSLALFPVACGAKEHALQIPDDKIVVDAGPVCDPADKDCDGFTPAEGDCNDSDPLVNPGAFEYVGNKADDDCDGKIDNGYEACDQEALDVSKPEDAAKAMNICPAKFLVSAKYLKDTKPEQRAIRASFGPNITPQAGSTLLVLSNGKALVPGEPGFVDTQPGTSNGFTGARPSKYAAKPGCPDNTGSANDIADLELTLTAPTNARALSFDFRFFTAEYPDYYCSSFNDAFAAVLTADSFNKGKPKNISYGAQGELISVNVSFYSICVNMSDPDGGTGAADAGTNVYNGCTEPPSTVTGTGFGDEAKPSPHGATDWLNTKAPVKPGETITIRFAVWDESDGVLDSTVLLDNFTWDINPTTNETTTPVLPK